MIMNGEVIGETTTIDQISQMIGRMIDKMIDKMIEDKMVVITINAAIIIIDLIIEIETSLIGAEMTTQITVVVTTTTTIAIPIRIRIIINNRLFKICLNNFKLLFHGDVTFIYVND